MEVGQDTLQIILFLLVTCLYQEPHCSLCTGL